MTEQTAAEAKKRAKEERESHEGIIWAYLIAWMAIGLGSYLVAGTLGVGLTFVAFGAGTLAIVIYAVSKMK